MSWRTIDRTVFDGIAKPTPSDPPGLALDLGIDPDHASPAIEERPTGVSVVDRRIGLDRVRDRVVVGRRHLAVERAHDAAGHRSLEPERASERENRVTDRDRARVGEPQRLEQRLRRVDAQDCDVRRRIGSDELALSSAPFQRLTEIEDAPATTCWLVTMCPASS